jgi:hypothetical protein
VLQIAQHRRYREEIFMRIVSYATLAMVCGSAFAGSLEIKTLSTRPEFVSGGDVLIEVVAPAGTQPADINLQLNDKPATVDLTGVGGRFNGLVTGLKAGKNVIAATMQSPERAKAKLVVQNHPITGPILSGPHLKPYECRTVESGLGQPLDADCSAHSKLEYFYRSTDSTFKPLPTGARPADLASTTTNDGDTIAYIVRVESGTINRTIYRIAVIADPAVGDLPGWNRKLVVSFGGGAGTQYNQGTNQAKDALNDLYLSRGFAHMVATELVNQLHGNAVLQGETLMMLKEHFIEHYGVPKWTVGSGGSGGAIQQLLITEMYPGLLDGLQPSLSFPDSSLHTADCGLFQTLWRKLDPKVWTDAKKAAFEGYTKGTCGAWERSFVPVLTATNAKGCALNDSSKIYDPVKNPKGVRCTMQEMRANIYGRDRRTGFARKPQDNIGWQYGLAGLNGGAISVDEFLEVNEKIGGNDLDGTFVAKRNAGDPVALRALYESGLMNFGGGGLANVPILHSRGYADMIGDIHDRERDLTIRARLERANGRSDNEVIWIGPQRTRGEATQSSEGSVRAANLGALSIDTMNKWLDAIVADPAPLTTDKVVRHKPPEAVDACFTDQGERINEVATFDGDGKCNKLFPVHSEPRLVAGAPLTNDIVKCRLKPISYADYKIAFTAEQKARMEKIFPTGVCDFSKPGVGQVPLKGVYQRY